MRTRCEDGELAFHGANGPAAVQRGHKSERQKRKGREEKGDLALAILTEKGDGEGKLCLPGLEACGVERQRPWWRQR